MTRLEKAAPGLTALAASIGQTIVRDGYYYSLQPSWMVIADTKKPDVELARKKIQTIIDARQQPSWGTPYERAGRILAGIEALEWKPGHIAEFMHPSRDMGCLAFSFGEWDAGIYLVELEPVKATGTTRGKCLEALAEKCRRVLR